MTTAYAISAAVAGTELGYNYQNKKDQYRRLRTMRAAFDVEDLQLWQIVMSKVGLLHSVYPRVSLQT